MESAAARDIRRRHEREDRMRGVSGCDHGDAHHGVDLRGKQLVCVPSNDPVTKMPIQMKIGDINLQFLNGVWTEAGELLWLRVYRSWLAGGGDLSVQQEIEILK